MKVLKYPIRLNKFDFSLLLPKDAEILKVDVQHGQTCMWALVDPSAEPEERQFRLTATGYDIEDEVLDSGLRFINTFFLHDGDLIFHLFEKRIEEKRTRLQNSQTER